MKRTSPTADRTKSNSFLINSSPPDSPLTTAEQVNLLSSYERKVSGRSARNVLTVALVTIVAQGLNGAGVLPLFQAYMLAYAVAAVIEYWIPPRPPSSFAKWVLKIAVTCINIYAGLQAIPKALSHFLWPPLAYGLPAFSLFLIIYWVPPLYPMKRKDKFKVWILASLGFALFWGWVGPHAKG